MTVERNTAMQPEQHHPIAARTDEGPRPRHRRRRRSLWAETFGAPMWRSAAYGVLSLPVGIASLLLALAGAHPAAARLQRGLADRWLRRALTPPPGGDRWGRVVLQALLASMLGVACWLLVALAGPNTVRNVLLYPITDGDAVARSWGGPTLAGAWAVHAGLALLLLPVALWLLRALSGLQGRLAARLLGSDQAPWVVPLAVLVAALGLLWLRAFATQL
jgi:hypothetical protein